MPTTPLGSVAVPPTGSLTSRIVESGAEAQRLAVFVALSKIKREVREFFAEHPTLQDLQPTRLLREEHMATDDYVRSLEAVKVRIETLRGHARRLGGTARDLLARARACLAAGEHKRTSKTDAVEFLKADAKPVYESYLSFVRRRVRTTHVASTVLYDALGTVAQTASTGTVRARALELQRQLEPLRVKLELKRQINAFLQDPALGDLRVRKTVRADHAPTADLIARLEAVDRDLTAFSGGGRTIPKAGEPVAPDSLTRVNTLIETLRGRKASKQRRDELVEKIRGIEADIPKLKDAVKGFEQHLEEQRRLHQIARAEAATRLGALEAQLEKAQEGAVRARAEADGVSEVLEVLRDFSVPEAWELKESSGSREACVGWLIEARGRITAATPGAPEDEPLAVSLQLEIIDAATGLARTGAPRTATPEAWVEAAVEGLAASRAAMHTEVEGRIAKAEAALRALREEEAGLCAELDAADRTLDELATLVDFCVAQRAEIKRAKEACRTFWQDYKNTSALVFYFGLNDNIQDRLLALGRFVKGYNDNVDAMGRIEVVLVFDAGVRAGTDVGFAALSASVQLTLVLSGALEVIDSREMTFEYRLALYLTAGAKAKLALPGSSEGVDADLQEPPKALLDAAAKCKCSLWDRTGWDVYGSDRIWAAHWSHGIARRIAFLRSVKVKSDGSEDASLSEEWVDRQVERLLSEPAPRLGGEGATVAGSWRTMLEERAELLGELKRTPPRQLKMVRTDRLDAEAHVAVGDRRLALGEKGRYRAEFALSEASASGGREVSRALGRLVEDACTFEFTASGSKDGGKKTDDDAGGEPKTVTNLAASGRCVYHEWAGEGGAPAAPPGKATAARAYLEVSIEDGQRIGPGTTWGFTTSGTIAPTLRNAAQLRALATALEHAVPAPEQPKVALPGRLGDDEAVLEMLASASHLRAEMVMSRGELSPLKKRMRTLETWRAKVGDPLESLRDKVTTADEKLGKLGEIAGRPPSLPGPLAGVVDVGALASSAGAAATAVKEVLAPVKAVLDVVVEPLEAIGEELKGWLKNTAAVSLRWTRSWRCSLGSGGALAWDSVWVPQLYRGLQLRDFRVTVEKEVPIVPCVSAFFGFDLRVRRRSVAFEVLGVGTFSYLKSLSYGFGRAGAADASVATALWTKFVELHRHELGDLCEQVAQAGSSAFSEVVIDALYGRRSAARAFGQACWDLYNPTRKNPFASLSEESVLEALKGTLKPGSEERPLRLVSLPTVPAPIALPAVPVTQLEAERLAPENLRRLQRLLRERRSLRGEAHVDAFSGLSAAAAALRRLVALKALAAKITGPDAPSSHSRRSDVEEAAATAVEAAVRRQREHELALDEVLATMTDPGARPIEAARDLHERFLAEAALFEALEGSVREAAARLELPHAGPPRGEGAGALLHEMPLAAVAALRIDGVPNFGQWQASSRVSWVIRSTATKKLDGDVEQYHAVVTRWVAPVDREADGIDARLARLAEGLVQRLSHAATLLRAIDAWRGGKDENDSNRAPRVGWFLEAPTLRQQLAHQLCLAQLRLRRHLVERLALAEELEAALRAYEVRAGAERDRCAKLEADELRRKLAETERKAAVASRNGQVAGLVLDRVRRKRQAEAEATRRVGAIASQMLSKYLAEYLRESAEDYAVDAILHGQRKLVD